MKLPIDYTLAESRTRAKAREQYIEEQGGKCWYCECDIHKDPPKGVSEMKINWELFPKFFMSHPIHLQHDHNTGLTEGAVHAYCNAVLWQYYGR